MNIILYADDREKTKNELLRKTIESKVSHEHLEVLQCFEDLSHRIHRFPRDIDVAVLCAKNLDQLYGLVALKDLLEGIQVILILPNRLKNTVAKGLELYPRFLGYADSDFKDVGAVLEKMLTRDLSKSISRQGILNFYR